MAAKSTHEPANGKIKIQGKTIRGMSIDRHGIAEENYELRMWEFPRAIAMKTDLPVMASQEHPTKILLERIDLRMPRHGLPDFSGKLQADVLAWWGHNKIRRMRVSLAKRAMPESAIV